MADDNLTIGDVDPEGRTKPGELHMEVGKSPAIEPKPLAEGGGGEKEPGANAPDKSALLREAYRRGLLPPEKKALFEEAQRRGIISLAPANDIAPAIGGANAAVSEIVPAAKRRFDEMQRRAKEVMDQATGRDKDVDYGTGISFLDQVALAQADNDKEKELYLANRYGASNVGRDKGGRFYVKTKGKKIAAEPGFTADIAGMGPELVGGGVGAALGAGVGGPPGAIGGAALGTALGKSATEAVKGLAGRSNKNFAQTMSAINKEAAFGALGEGIGRPIAAGVNRITSGPIPKMLSGVTPESQDLTRQTLRGGAVPPAVSALPSAKRVQWQQAFSRKVVGPFKDQETRNQAFIENEIKNMLRESGVPESHVDQIFKAIIDPKSAISTRDLGKDIQSSIRAHVEMLQSVAQDEMQDATQILDRQLAHLDTLTRRYRPGDLGVDVAKGVQQARKDFSTAAAKIYDRVDRLVGDEPLVPTKLMKREASAILKALPKSDNRTVIHEIAELPGAVSFGDAQRLRTRLRELATSTNLTPGAIKGDFSRLENAVDVSFNLAAKDPRAEPAVALLTAADRFYADGIRKFNDTTINQLVRNIKAGLPPDPSVIADQIVQPGQKARVEEIKKMLPPQVWQRVMGSDFDNIIKASTRSIEGREVVTGKSLQAELARRGRLVDVVYGPRITNQIREYAARLVARDGEMPAANLNMDNFSASLMRVEAASQTLDEFMKKNFLAALADPKKMPDDALRWIVKPGQEERLAQAIKFFGENSPQVQAIRQAALRSLLSRAIANTESGVSHTIQGAGLETALRQYTNAQQEMLFPNGLADDIRLLAKEAKFLFPGLDEDMSAGLAAGFVKKMPLPVYAAFAIYPAIYGWFVSRPAVMRALALGLRSDGPMRQAAKEAFRTLARAAVLGAAPGTEGAP